MLPRGYHKMYLPMATVIRPFCRICRFCNYTGYHIRFIRYVSYQMYDTVKYWSYCTRNHSRNVIGPLSQQEIFTYHLMKMVTYSNPAVASTQYDTTPSKMCHIDAPLSLLTVVLFSTLSLNLLFIVNLQRSGIKCHQQGVT